MIDRFADQQRIRELEKTVMDLRQKNEILRSQVEEYKSKEQTISSAIIASMEHAKQLEASRKKLYSLDIQRSRLMYLRMEQIINDLYRRYPELRKDSTLREMSEKFKTMVFNDLSEKTVESNSIDIKQPSDDPIKKLLRNIIDCFDTKKTDTQVEKVTKDTHKEIKKEETPLTNIGVTSSGFDLNEALHPTMGLDEIMKSFNLGKKDGQR